MKNILPLILWLLPLFIKAQVYEFNQEEITHRIFIDTHYFIETAFSSEDNSFLFTRGGFYEEQGQNFSVNFEFNSTFAEDSLQTKRYTKTSDWNNVSKTDQALEGKWLMAGRVKPEGEQRRNLDRSRKTMKILLDGHFQWTAFDTASMRFIAAGGGTYSASEGNYVEMIDYFSRNTKTVGKKLPFEYLRKKDDWYHKGNNSKGAPMHEIWSFRKN